MSNTLQSSVDHFREIHLGRYLSYLRFIGFIECIFRLIGCSWAIWILILNTGIEIGDTDA